MKSVRVRYMVMALCIGAALFIGIRDTKSQSIEARVNQIGSQIRCPVCDSQSAIESETNAAVAVRDEIENRLRNGQGEAEIKAYFVSRFGQGILLKPGTDNLAWIYWVAPIGAIGVGAMIFYIAVSKRKSRQIVLLSDEERSEIEREVGRAH